MPIEREQFTERVEGPIQLTKEEYETISSLKLDDPQMQELLKSKGITIESGDVEVEIDGQLHKMKTSRNDFGTLLLPENEAA